MSLFGTIQLGSNTLKATQIGLQVAGNNIANANTPGYVRQHAIFQPATTQKIGDLSLGGGVLISGIVHQIDHFLEDRVRGSASDLANGEAQESAFVDLEALVGELGDTDLSSSMTSFFNALHDVTNQPGNVSVRNVALSKGKALAEDIQRLSSRVDGLRAAVDKRIAGSANDINRLLEEIAQLNVQIVSIEGKSAIQNEAVGLRDQRLTALESLAKLIDIRVTEQVAGSVSVFSGGDILVFDGTSRSVTTQQYTDRNLGVTRLVLTETDAELLASGGSLAGNVAARDEILGGFQDELNSFARTLMFEFNRVHSSGQGAAGYRSLTSEFSATDTTAPLDAAGLPFTPVNGSFQVQIRNPQTNNTTTTEVQIDLNGLEDDTSLDDLVAGLDAIEGLSASLDVQGRLQLTSEAVPLEFAFGEDTSGILAALGINHFFSGSSAADMGVRADLLRDPSRLSVSRGGVGRDNQMAASLASLLDSPLDSAGGSSLAMLYERFTMTTVQGAGNARAVADGFRVFHTTLSSQKLSISGVSIDDEAVQMMTLQRGYQAAAKLISVVSDLLQTLINL